MRWAVVRSSELGGDWTAEHHVPKDSCWKCHSTDLQAGGFDGNGDPITVCAICHERQEEE